MKGKYEQFLLQPDRMLVSTLNGLTSYSGEVAILLVPLFY